jgi:Cu(I)/Ag(I) efflux system membrane fusion protein
MKQFKLLFVIILMTGFALNISAQTNNQSNLAKTSMKTESIKVWGNCEMCKDRIEKTVKSAGATSATWDQKSKLLTMSFDPSKNSVESFSKKLADVGHDTEKYKADDKVYNALPACCKYERKK